MLGTLYQSGSVVNTVTPQQEKIVWFLSQILSLQNSTCSLCGFLLVLHFPLTVTSCTFQMDRRLSSLQVWRVLALECTDKPSVSSAQHETVALSGYIDIRIQINPSSFGFIVIGSLLFLKFEAVTHRCMAETPTPGLDRAAGFQAPGPTRLLSDPELSQSPRRPLSHRCSHTSSSLTTPSSSIHLQT